MVKQDFNRNLQKICSECFINWQYQVHCDYYDLVGCSRSTAKNMLYKLVNEGKVNKIEIEGDGYDWQKVKGD